MIHALADIMASNPFCYSGEYPNGESHITQRS
jgi:hypothetical protein